MIPLGSGSPCHGLTCVSESPSVSASNVPPCATCVVTAPPFGSPTQDGHDTRFAHLTESILRPSASARARSSSAQAVVSLVGLRGRSEGAGGQVGGVAVLLVGGHDPPVQTHVRGA